MWDAASPRFVAEVRSLKHSMSFIIHLFYTGASWCLAQFSQAHNIQEFYTEQCILSRLLSMAKREKDSCLAWAVRAGWRWGGGSEREFVFTFFMSEFVGFSGGIFEISFLPFSSCCMFELVFLSFIIFGWTIESEIEKATRNKQQHWTPPTREAPKTIFELRLRVRMLLWNNLFSF